MSSSGVTKDKICMEELFDGRLEAYGVFEHVGAKRSRENRRVLTGKGNYLQVYADDRGNVSLLIVPALTPAEYICRVIERIFVTKIYSEYQPEYWGFETHEEWDAEWKDMGLFERNSEDRDALYAAIHKFVSGEEHGIRPHTARMELATIAKELVSKNQGLMRPEENENLLAAIDKAYERKRTITAQPSQYTQ